MYQQLFDECAEALARRYDKELVEEMRDLAERLDRLSEPQGLEEDPFARDIEETAKDWLINLVRMLGGTPNA